MKIGIRNLFVLLVLFGLAAFPVAASAWTEQDGTPAETQQEKPESEPDDEFDDFDESDEFEGDWEDDEEDEVARSLPIRFANLKPSNEGWPNASSSSRSVCGC